MSTSGSTQKSSEAQINGKSPELVTYRAPALLWKVIMSKASFLSRDSREDKS